MKTITVDITDELSDKMPDFIMKCGMIMCNNMHELNATDMEINLEGVTAKDSETGEKVEIGDFVVSVKRVVK